MTENKPLVITEFGGPLTRRNDGDINSGLAKFETSWGYDPYTNPGNLTWMEQPISILTLAPANSSIATIYNMKFRDEGGVSRVYAIGGVTTDPNLYRIVVANNSTPDLDSASIISTLAGNLQYSTGMVFYGSTEKIFFGSSSAIERVNFDGSNQSVMSNGVASFWGNVPRPMVPFLGKIYFGNFNNIGEIDSTELITTAQKLSPALPSGLYVTDLDTTPDGNYLQITATRTIPQIISGNGSTFPSRSTTDSYKFLWNGIDDSVTANEKFNGVTFFASEVFGNKNYSMGRDIAGAIVMDGRKKISLPQAKEGVPEATYSTGETLGFALPEYDKDASRYRMSLFHYGQWDTESKDGLYRLLRQPAQVLSDVKFIPSALPITSFGYAPIVSSFMGNISGTGKIYYSTSEVDASVINSMAHKLWRFNIVPTGLGSVVGGVYETQNQLFSKKIKLGEVRFYTEPLTTSDQSFSIGIVNSASSVIASNTFTVGTNVTAGEDLVRWTPQIAPTYALGFRITNLGTANWVGNKLEADINSGGT